MNPHFPLPRLLQAVCLLLGLWGVLFWAVPSEAQTVFGGYSAGIQVFNLENFPVNVTLTKYKADGSLGGSPIQDVLASNQSATYFPLGGLPSDFIGSLVVQTTDGDIVALGNLHAAGMAANGSLIGQTSGATTVRLPLLHKNNGGYYSWFSVQNTSGSNATVTVNYSDNTSVTRTIAPHAAQLFFQIQEPHNQAIFAAKLTSNQPVVVGVVQESLRSMLTYTGFAGDGSSQLVFPLINANNVGYSTGIQIQNNGAQSTNITVSYTPSPGSGNGTACSETQTIPAGQARTFALHVFAPGESNAWDQASNCVDGARFVGSAKVSTNSAGQALTAIVNQTNASNYTEGSYGAFDPSGASSKVVFPLILDRRSGWWTGFNVQHVGGPASNVTCIFSNSDYTVSANLALGQALNHIQNNVIANNYVGSAICQASNTSTRLVGVVNESGPNTSLDQLLVYEGINVSP